MTIITDATAADSLLEKYAVRAPLTIIVIAKAEDRFSPSTVKNLLDTGAEIMTAPKGASIPFMFGLAIGKANGREGDVYVLSSDADVKKTAELMGYNTALKKKVQAKGKQKTGQPKMTANAAESGDNQSINPPENAKKTAKSARTRPHTDSDKQEAEKAENGAKNGHKKASKFSTEQSEKTDSSPKKISPKHEQVYTDNSDTAGSKPTAEFLKAITKTGVNKADAAGVWQAVVKSSASIVYDMQLRLCLLDADKAKDIYEKTRDIFSDLKEMTR